jgi:cell division protein FtsB
VRRAFPYVGAAFRRPSTGDHINACTFEAKCDTTLSHALVLFDGIRYPAIVIRTSDSPGRLSAPRMPPAQRLVTIGLVVATSVLVLNVLVGTRGLPAVFQARRDHQAASSELQRIREENTRLRQEIMRLRSDPSAIEELARRELGFISPGEKVFIIRDARPVDAK